MTTQPRRNPAVVLAACAAAGAPFAASAHHAMDNATPANAWQGLVSGLAHPVLGIDHLLFMLAVGVACYAFRRGVATIAIFLSAVLAGTVFHLREATLPQPDAWVAASLIVLGLFLFRRSAWMKGPGAAAFLALAGLAHGYAYGESIVGAEPTPLYAYLIGYTIAQLAILSLSYAAARYLDRVRSGPVPIKAIGGALSLAGAALLFIALRGV